MLTNSVVVDKRLAVSLPADILSVSTSLKRGIRELVFHIRGSNYRVTSV